MRIWNGYFYSNGHYLKNPSIFIFVPNGFSLQPESFKLSMSNKIGSSSAIQQIKPKDYVGNATIWKIDLEKEFNRAAGGNVNMTFDIQVDNDAIPRITYDFSQFMFVGSDNPKYQTAAIR